MISRPLSASSAPALDHVRTFETYDNRHPDPDFLHSADNALRDQITTHDSAEDIDQDRLDVVIGEDQFECRSNPFAGCSAANIQKVGRLTAVQLDQVHRGHGQTGAIDHARDIAIQRHIVQIVRRGFPFLLILLTWIAQLRQPLLAEQGVVLDVDLRIQREHVTAAGNDEWIYLDQACVTLQEQPIQTRP